MDDLLLVRWRKADCGFGVALAEIYQTKGLVLLLGIINKSLGNLLLLSPATKLFALVNVDFLCELIAANKQAAWMKKGGKLALN